jgi:hypothetical protein
VEVSAIRDPDLRSNTPVLAQAIRTRSKFSPGHSDFTVLFQFSTTSCGPHVSSPVSFFPSLSLHTFVPHPPTRTHCLHRGTATCAGAQPPPFAGALPPPSAGAPHLPLAAPLRRRSSIAPPSPLFRWAPADGAAAVGKIGLRGHGSTGKQGRSVGGGKEARVQGEPPRRWERGGEVGTGAAEEPSRREVSISCGLLSGGIEVPCVGSWPSSRAAPPLLPAAERFRLLEPFLARRLHRQGAAGHRRPGRRPAAAAAPWFARSGSHSPSRRRGFSHRCDGAQGSDGVAQLPPPSAPAERRRAPPFPILPCRGAEKQRRTEVGPPQAVAHPWMGTGFDAHVLGTGPVCSGVRRCEQKKMQDHTPRSRGMPELSQRAASEEASGIRPSEFRNLQYKLASACKLLTKGTE